jgi:hypothetical protein
MNSIEKENIVHDSSESKYIAVKGVWMNSIKTGRLLSAFTLIEAVISITIALIVILSTGVLLYSGNRIWFNTYSSVHRQIKQDALTTMLNFGQVGRKSNRLNYRIYNVSGDTFTSATPASKTGEEVVSGDAVEFRYWDVEFDSSDSHNLLDPDKTATAYALFYLDGDVLKVDYGPYPPGGVSGGGGTRNTTGITTVVLAENVQKKDKIGAFSHTVVNNVGRGCVRIDVTLTDPNSEESVKVMTAAMMRNIWPR